MTQIGGLQSVPADVKRDIAHGVEILKKGRCRDVFILGSVAEERVRNDSDIDFAVRGCPPEQFFRLQGRLLMALGRPADLIDLDVDAELAAFLEREAVPLHVG